MKFMNALMPGEHNYQQGLPMPGQTGAPMAAPQKKRSPVMNALSSVFEFGAPEAFQAGRDRRTQSELGNMLAAGDVAGAGKYAYQRGQLELGDAYTGQASEMDAAKRKQEAQGVLTLFGQGPQFVNQYAMEDPAGFESQTGMTAEEYLQAAGRFGDGGQQFAQFALQKAQAELGQDVKGPEAYTLTPGARRYGPDGKLIAENPTAEKPTAQWEEYTPPGGIPGLFQKNVQTGEIKRVAAPQSGGIRIGADGTVQIGGPVDGLGYGSAPKGQDAAIAFDRQGNPIVTPGPQQEAYNKAVRGLEEFTAQNAIVVEDIDRALAMASGWSTGAGAALKDLPIVGGITPAGQMESLLSTIEANVGFDKLQAMREASPTGGALGAVTERELAFLQAVFGSLRQDTSEENFRYNLTRLKQHMQGREQRLREAMAADFPSLAQTADRRGAANQQLQALSEDEAAELEQLRRELGVE